MELILIILTSTLLSALFFAFYQYGIRVGMKKQADIDSKKEDVVEIKDKDNHNKVRNYKQLADYQG